MGKPRTFTTLPVAMIADTSLTALEIRCAAIIALHDGMSARLGKGAGCYAKNSTLAALARTDPTNFSKALSRLIKKGYVSREPQLMDRRLFTLRVQYPEDETWRDDQQSTDSIDPKTGEIVGGPAKPDPEIVGEGESKNGRISKENGKHYISLNEEIDFDKSKEINSIKWRTSDSLPQASEKLDAPQGGCAKVSVWQHLPSNIEGLPLGAQVARIEKAFDAIGRNADSIIPDERTRLSTWLLDIADTCIGGDMDATGQQANRLWEEVAVF